MSKRTRMLDLSLIFGAAYHVLFIVGYLLQKPLLFGGLVDPEVLESIETIYHVPIIIIAAVCGICFALFVLLMRKNTSRGLFIGAAVFSGIAFIAERIAFSAVASSLALLDKLLAEKGELGVTAFNMNRSAVSLLDMYLLPLFAAAIVLMCCAACVKNENS